jgi:hypothetical protein
MMTSNQSVRNLLLALLLVFSGMAVWAQTPDLRFKADKKFKIVQFTDTHIIADDPASEAALKRSAKFWIRRNQTWLFSPEMW